MLWVYVNSPALWSIFRTKKGFEIFNGLNPDPYFLHHEKCKMELI